MWNTVLKLVGQLLIAKFLRKYMQDTEVNMNNNTKNHLGAVKQSLAALVESHAVLFKPRWRATRRAYWS